MAGSVISTKYPADCAECGTPIPVGAQARYYGKRRAYGLGCHERPQKATSEPVIAAVAPIIEAPERVKVREGDLARINRRASPRPPDHPKPRREGDIASMTNRTISRAVAADMRSAAYKRAQQERRNMGADIVTGNIVSQGYWDKARYNSSFIGIPPTPHGELRVKLPRNKAGGLKCPSAGPKSGPDYKISITRSSIQLAA
jgi:hypothetical protein